MINKLTSLYNKNKAIFLYLVFGFCTTLLNFLIFGFLTYVVFTKNNISDIQISNLIAWIASVLFAYITNKKFVFQNKSKKAISLLKFYLCRIFTLVIEAIGIFIFIKYLNIDKLITKLTFQAVVIILNYILSKYWVFKEKEQSNMKYINFSFFICFIILILCFGFTYKALQNDTFYSIPIGRDILKHGVDMLDHYSFHNLPYTYPHWLFDVFTYLIYNNFGFDGIYIVTILLYMLLGILIYTLSVKLYNNRFASGVFAITAVICMQEFITMRAQLVTYILFVLEFYFIEKFISTSNKKLLIALPIISLLIVNLHCAVWAFFFILFLPAIAEYIMNYYKNKEIKLMHKPKGKYLPCKEKIDIFEEKLEIDNVCPKSLILTMLGCILTGFITLNKFTPFTYIIKTYEGDTLTWIVEHIPPMLWGVNNLLLYLCIILFIIIFLKVKIKLRDFFLVLGLIILALSSYRHIALLIIISSFICIKYVSKYVESKNKTLTDSLIEYFNKLPVRVLIMSLIIILAGLNYLKIYKTEYVGSEYPVEAVKYIKENLDYKEIRLYNDYNYGSYILFEDVPVFIDSRADLYTLPFNGVRDITADFQSIGSNYKETFEYYDITHALIYSESKLFKIFDFEDNYTLLYKDDVFAVFSINEAKTDEL